MDAHLISRVGPVLLFLVAMTVIAELADDAGVFDVTAVHAAGLAKGSVRRLWLLIVVLASVTTILLSIDTTAVLLTPVVLSLCDRLEIEARPFAMTTVWLANTASLLLPVSNLTNLLALRRLRLGAAEFAGRMWFAALVSIVMTVAFLAVRYHRHLRGRYEIPEQDHVGDRVLFAVAAVVCLSVGPAALLGADVPLVASIAAVLLVLTYAWRRRSVLRIGLVPWRLLALVIPLFIAVDVADRHGLGDLLRRWLDPSDSTVAVLRDGAVAAGMANAMNNLPSYLALEPAAAGRSELLVIVTGSNVGPLVLLWGSLATLLWRERCRARGVRIGAWDFALTGVVGVPLVLGTALLALSVT